MTTEPEAGADMLDGLRPASAYPHPVDAVTSLETHISHLFFAGEFVYKVKRRASRWSSPSR